MSELTGIISRGRSFWRKIENPVDNLFLDICKFVTPMFKKLRHTPNIITTYSGVTAAISVRALYRYEPVAFAIFFWSSYFFDCLDGFFAREYGMESRLGDHLDHGKDALHSIGIASVYLTRYNFTEYELATFLVIILLGFKHIGCQQRISKANADAKDESIDILMKLCPNAESIKWTRFFGGGTMAMVLPAIIWYNTYRNNYRKTSDGNS